MISFSLEESREQRGVGGKCAKKDDNLQWNWWVSPIFIEFRRWGDAKLTTSASNRALRLKTNKAISVVQMISISQRVTEPPNQRLVAGSIAAATNHPRAGYNRLIWTPFAWFPRGWEHCRPTRLLSMSQTLREKAWIKWNHFSRLWAVWGLLRHLFQHWRLHHGDIFKLGDLLVSRIWCMDGSTEITTTVQ